MSVNAFLRALVPAPVVSVAVVMLWLLLNGLTPGQLLFGAVLALLLPHLLPPAPAATPRLRAPTAALRLAGVVLYDIVKANIDVARRILGPEDAIRPVYVWVPLDIASPQGIALFASIITMTPGTLSCEVSADRRWLLVHCFHADDPAAVVADAKSRYERPLMEVFR